MVYVTECLHMTVALGCRFNKLFSCSHNFIGPLLLSLFLYNFASSLVWVKLFLKILAHTFVGYDDTSYKFIGL